MFAALNLRNLSIPAPVFAAPLAGITDRPYRQILRDCAPSAPIMTEMISSHSLVENSKRTLKANSNRNFDNYASEGLIGAQIFGADPRIMAESAKILEQNGASWIDINMGCPVPKVATRAGAGAFLMRDHKLAGEIVALVVRAVKIPVSIKTRLGWDTAHPDSVNLVRIAANAGAQFAIIHGRTRAQGYAGNADFSKCGNWNVECGIPVIFNGDLKTENDLEKIKNMGADGAMIGRALLGNPWLLGKLNGYSAPQIPHSKLILEHLHLTLSYYGVRTGVPLFRKHAAWYATGMKNCAAFRMRVNQITVANEMESAVREFFCCNAENT